MTPATHCSRLQQVIDQVVWRIWSFYQRLADLSVYFVVSNQTGHLLWSRL